MLKWPGGAFGSGERAWKLFLHSWLQGRVLCLDVVLGHTSVCRFRACAASVLSLLKCALWSTFNKVDERLTVLQHVSIHVDFSKMYVCLQVNCSWKSETHGKGVRSQLKVCSQCQPNTGILLDSSSNEYWMLFWKSLFIQGVLFST